MTTLKPPFRASDMKGLHQKVIKGVYPNIPNTYSQELANFIKTLLQVSPVSRPSCESIMKMESIKKRMTLLIGSEVNDVGDQGIQD